MIRFHREFLLYSFLPAKIAWASGGRLLLTLPIFCSSKPQWFTFNLLLSSSYILHKNCSQSTHSQSRPSFFKCLCEPHCSFYLNGLHPCKVAHLCVVGSGTRRGMPFNIIVIFDFFLNTILQRFVTSSWFRWFPEERSSILSSLRLIFNVTFHKITDELIATVKMYANQNNILCCGDYSAGFV